MIQGLRGIWENATALYMIASARQGHWFAIRHTLWAFTTSEPYTLWWRQYKRR